MICVQWSGPNICRHEPVFLYPQPLRRTFRDVIWRHYAIISGFPGIYPLPLISRWTNQRILETRDVLPRSSSLRGLVCCSICRSGAIKIGQWRWNDHTRRQWEQDGVMLADHSVAGTIFTNCAAGSYLRSFTRPTHFATPAIFPPQRWAWKGSALSLRLHRLALRSRTGTCHDITLSPVHTKALVTNRKWTLRINPAYVFCS